jgi:YD repeat-containing protein
MIDPGGRTTYGYDAAGRIDHLANPWGERTSWTYDAASRPTVQRLGNGTRASYSYDAAGQVTRISNRKSDGTVLSQVDYAYLCPCQLTAKGFFPALLASGDAIPNPWSKKDP